MNNYNYKYYKYKNRYINYKNQHAGAPVTELNIDVSISRLKEELYIIELELGELKLRKLNELELEKLEELEEKKRTLNLEIHDLELKKINKSFNLNEEEPDLSILIERLETALKEQSNESNITIIKTIKENAEAKHYMNTAKLEIVNTTLLTNNKLLKEYEDILASFKPGTKVMLALHEDQRTTRSIYVSLIKYKNEDIVKYNTEKNNYIENIKNANTILHKLNIIL